MALVYGGAMNDGEAEVEGFVNSDYAGCMDTRKSLFDMVSLCLVQQSVGKLLFRWLLPYQPLKLNILLLLKM